MKARRIKAKRDTSSGKVFEDILRLVSEKCCDLPTVTHKEKSKQPEEYSGLSHLETNSPYPSIKSDKGRKGRQEFVLHFIKGALQENNIFLSDEDGSVHIRIDCKMQKVNGSTDEKLLFPLENARERRFPERNFVLLHGGKGASRGMLKYVKEKGKEVGTMNFQVLSLKEFSNILNDIYQNT